MNPALDDEAEGLEVEFPEGLVDARTASDRLKIPLAWLRTRPRRRLRKIPYYRLGHLIRFRLSELVRWRNAHARVVTAGVETGGDD